MLYEIARPFRVEKGMSSEYAIWVAFPSFYAKIQSAPIRARVSQKPDSSGRVRLHGFVKHVVRTLTTCSHAGIPCWSPNAIGTRPNLTSRSHSGPRELHRP